MKKDIETVIELLTAASRNCSLSEIERKIGVPKSSILV